MLKRLKTLKICGFELFEHAFLKLNLCFNL